MTFWITWLSLFPNVGNYYLLYCSGVVVFLYIYISKHSVYTLGMKKIAPYSDEKMLYNETTEQYELQLAWVKAIFGNTFTDDGVLENRIKKNTRKILNYIYSHSYSGNRKIINALILKTEEYRTWFYDCLISQIEADLSSGYNDNDLYVSKSESERNLQFLNQVSALTENILDSSKGYGGINILSASVFPPFVYLTYGDFDK